VKESLITEKKFIAADLEKCTGCGTCELVCALKRENVYNPRSSRIKILRLYQLLNMAIVCRQCKDAPCIIACPQECLFQSEKTGVILVDEEKCDCCGWCIQACPYGAITLNPEKDTVMMCDQCDGDPQCVEWCPEKALDLVTKETFDQNIRKATEQKRINYKLSLSGQSGIDFQPENEKSVNVVNTKKSLNLLIEAFSETNPIEILIYGMFVKNELGSLIPHSKEKIEQTLELLTNAIKLGEKSSFSDSSKNSPEPFMFKKI